MVLRFGGFMKFLLEIMERYKNLFKSYAVKHALWRRATIKLTQKTISDVEWFKETDEFYTAKIEFLNSAVDLHKEAIVKCGAEIRQIAQTKRNNLYHLYLSQNYPELTTEERKVYLKMVKTLPDEAATEREWNFREDNNQHFYGDIPFNQERITLTLNWKPDSYSSSKLVGKYQIDLPLLLGKGFVRKASRGIQLRFQSTGEAIEIAIDRDSPALRIGSKPE
jgi:hypothetical protein